VSEEEDHPLVRLHEMLLVLVFFRVETNEH